MANEYDIVANRLLRAARNAASQQTDEEESFQSLVNATRRSFRRADPVTPSPRGRKKKNTFSRKILLTKLAHVDFLPGTNEQHYLRTMGMGESNELLLVQRDSNITEIKEDILLLYPTHIQNLLKMSGFRLAKCDRSKRIHFMENIYNSSDFERELGSGKIIVIPKNDFPNDLPIINQNDNRRNPLQPRPAVTEMSREQNSSHRRLPSPPATASHSTVDRVEYVLEQFDTEEVNVDVETDNSAILFLPTLPEDADIYQVDISRSNCVREMFNIYSDRSIVDKKLIVTFRDELGVDGGGLTKELFNIFFKEIEDKYFRGEDCIIPFLELNKMNEKNNFVIIGRILEHMLLLTGSIPSKFSKIGLTLLADPEKNIEEDILLQELYAYVNPYLRHVLKKGIQYFDMLSNKERELLQDFFQSYKFFELPNSQKFRQQLHLIATEILIESPKRLLDMIRKGISLEKYEFWAKCDFNTLADMQKITPAKVANCVVTDDDLTQNDSRILHYLDMYIRCLSNENASLLVFMITGVMVFLWKPPV